jgi:GDPmannose 4,6-dehydratase
VTRALVTGASGQTGSYLTEELLASGVEVHGIHREAAPGSVVADGVTMHVADLADFDAVRSIVADVDPDEVYNLAALSSVAASWERPVETALLNGAAVANLLDAVAALEKVRPGRRFVQASSAEIFGYAAEAPQSESTPIRPTNPYGASKAYAHSLTGAYRASGLHASSVILYNHESPRRPEQFVTRKITAGIARIARGEESVISLGNLDARRDWGWAPDYAHALRLVAAADAPDDFVVATGESHSIRDLVQAAIAAAGLTGSIDDYVRVDERFLRPTDAPDLRGDATRIRTALGWAPTRAFDEIVAAMVEADLTV